MWLWSIGRVQVIQGSGHVVMEHIGGVGGEDRGGGEGYKDAGMQLCGIGGDTGVWL